MSKVADKKKYIIVNNNGLILESCYTTELGLKRICKRLKKEYIGTLYILTGMSGWILDVKSYIDDYRSDRVRQGGAKLTIDFSEITML